MELIILTWWVRRLMLAYRVSWNNSRRWLLFFRAKRGRLFEGGDYFQILFTTSHAPNILFYFAIKSKNNHINETEHGLFKSSTFGSLINFHCQYPRCRLISFAGLSSRFTAMGIDNGLPVVVGGGRLRRRIKENLIIKGDFLKNAANKFC